ncbi:MAG TPA: hypothetical protein VN711_00330 [Candidatus Saccharimonadales bacterium]|nr:hypothetical protein [Candidatus Saccharimonadales bacterium]
MIKKLSQQLIPLLLTVVIFLSISVLLYFFIQFLDSLPIHQKIIPRLHLADVLIGLTIYIKTAIDFAIFIGNLMQKHPGWKNRISIESGTAFGNFLGTLFILTVWTFFKEVPLLLIMMIVVAALVLLGMAEEGLNDFYKNPLHFFSTSAKTILQIVFVSLQRINSFAAPLTRLLLPKTAAKDTSGQSSFFLFFYAVTIPLVLGLDDFAGYIPLFTVVNVFGFAIGVFLGHMLLTASLFASPSFTTKVVRSSFILLFGSLAFIGISLWGFYEAAAMLLHLIFG